MIAVDELAALAVGDLDGEALDAVEQHVLACGACAATLERLIALGDGVRALVAAGRVNLNLTADLVARLDGAGLVSRTYRVTEGATVACAVGADDIYALTVLEAPLADAMRVDVIAETPIGAWRFDDVPFDAEAGLVQLVQRSDLIRTYPSMRIEFRLFASGKSDTRQLGPFTLEHTGFSG